jgi:DNA-binding CsgD family transcriptional regulator
MLIRVSRRRLSEPALLRQEIIALSYRGLGAQELLAGVSRVLRRAISFDGFGWHLTDPATLLVTEFGLRSHPEVALEPVVENEFLEDDVAKFTDLARRRRPVASITTETAGDPRRSPRMRKLLAPRGVHDELRAALVTCGACWGVSCLLRAEESAGPFTEADERFVASVAAHIAEGLRSAITPRGPVAARSCTGDVAEPIGPGTLLLAADGRVILAITREAESLLREFTGWRGSPSAAPDLVHALVARARGRARGRPGPIPRVRVQTRAGRWLEIHAAMMRTIDSAAHHSNDQPSWSVTIQPASPDRVAPLMLEAYGLSQREQEVVALVLRGLTTAEIAQQLQISPHTARDHLKAIFAKTGVARRGELAARLYIETLPRPRATHVPGGG